MVMGKDDELVDLEASEETVTEWVEGLPSLKDLPPLSQSLISPLLASAFSITPEHCQSIADVDRASQKTIAEIRRKAGSVDIPETVTRSSTRDESSVLGEDDGRNGGGDRRASVDGETAEAVSGMLPENLNDKMSTLKRPRLVWTPPLHKRFIDVIGHLGINNAIPKTIMQLMNVEGLTRENVASHLQKYRLYLQRMQGNSDEGPSSSDHLLISIGAPSTIAGESTGRMPIPMPHIAPFGLMPVTGAEHDGGSMALPTSSPGVYDGFEMHPCNVNGRSFVTQ